ncbi:hypothetical protein F3F96_04755 [Mariprofundus sp. NF]|uniref:gamma-mobile-trio integrase GmtZ n=1 Tax=Mariprofundus sp. NF TaxID=2608716 RepID=UPI0015A00C6E|nr:integrase family protein [Mariprofundus sp. NF]NWF38438.1 hypothetical protein [Mariprofundus sp. NF]
MVRRESINRSRKVSDHEFNYVLKINPAFEEWRLLACEWFQNQHSGRDFKHKALDKFLVHYLYQCDLEMNPYNFLLRANNPTSFWNQLEMNTVTGIKYNNYVHDFLKWVIEEKLSIEDGGARYIPAEYHNPIPKRSQRGIRQSETYKNPLPFRYIRELRGILNEGENFSDWKWAQNFGAAQKGSAGGDWFEASPCSIDISDPDCVWRKRTVNNNEITELWSPVRAMLIYIKLELPLREHQVRMLDSGEADTFRYENGKWDTNNSTLATGTEKRPYLKGVFHRDIDLKSREIRTGFYINTNKTADINESEANKGYVIPWQNEKVLYWLEKLRNWQEKYNPIIEPISWTKLEAKHFGYAKPHDSVLEERGSACFLFRHASAIQHDDRSLPVPAVAANRLWYQLLSELEERCTNRGETLDDGSPILFVDPNSNTTTCFSLHSLRVSLITAYALDGGVPFPILSKMIVGHSRLIMTLYYTKAGKAHVTEVMQEAEKRMLETDQSSYRRFLKEATYKQIEENFAFNDPAALLGCQKSSPAGFVFEDKGICPMGCSGCDIGGMQLRSVASAPVQNIYAPTPGYPEEKNCVRCRFFITGPAFLPGMIAHFNHVSYKLTEASERYVQFEMQVAELEDLRAECAESDAVFSKATDLQRISRHHEQEAQKVDKLANDLHATLRLIDRCKQLLETNGDDDEVKLVPSGQISDLQYALEEVESEMYQLEILCENAVLFPETDSSKPSLRRAQILDSMFERNGYQPVFFKLSPNQQLAVGNHLMHLIKSRVGSLKGAVSVAEGKVKLNQLGLLDDTENILIEYTGQALVKQQMSNLRSNEQVHIPEEVNE